MHGAGNDYIYINTLLYNIADPSAMAVAWSAYHTGIAGRRTGTVSERRIFK